MSLMAILPSASAATDMPFEVSLSFVQRKDNLSWNIAGSTANVLSELKWEKMSISQLQAAGELHLSRERRIRANLGFGVINSGTNQDSDFNGDNRTQEFSRSNNKAGGDVFDASIGMGKMLHLIDLSAGESFFVTPFVGLSIHQQGLTMTDGVQTLCIPPSCSLPLGPLPGLASSYDARWMGPWLGAEALIETERGWSMMANVEYHLVGYSASANWNLRADLAHPVSFRHIASGDGIVVNLGASYLINNKWKLDFIMERQNWSTQAGSDWIFLADRTVGYTRLNEVNWDSTAYYFGVIRKF